MDLGNDDKEKFVNLVEIKNLEELVEIASKKLYFIMLITAEWKIDKMNLAKLFYEKSVNFKMANFVASEYSGIATITDCVQIDFVPALVVIAYWPQSKNLPIRCMAKIEDTDVVSFSKFLDKWVDKIVLNRLKVSLEYEQFMLTQSKPTKFVTNVLVKLI